MKLFGNPAVHKLVTLALVFLGQTAHAASDPTLTEFKTPEAPAALSSRLDLLPAAADAKELSAAKGIDGRLDGKLAGSPLTRRETLKKVMQQYGDMTYVPYIWAGGKIGSRASCMECRACVDAKPRLKVERRIKTCSACQECGVDCSHFTNKVLGDAGLPFPYVDTRGMSRSSSAELRRKYNLIDIGTDVRKALPGDLLLYKHHVVMVFDSYGNGLGDILHVSRSIKRKGMGGIEVVRGQMLGKFRGRLLKILRHGILHDGEKGPAEKQRHMPSPDEVSRHQLVV